VSGSKARGGSSWHLAGRDATVVFSKGADSPWVGLAVAVLIGLLVYLNQRVRPPRASRSERKTCRIWHRSD